MMQAWSPASWQQCRNQQPIHYPSPHALADKLASLSQFPGLVTVDDIERLKQGLQLAEQGKCFILHGGDCAERFADCERTVVERKLALLDEASAVIERGLDCAVLPIGRIAGQYAKPRSQAEEQRGALTLPAYRGDLINDIEFSQSDRTPRPDRLETAYQCAAKTLSFMKERQQRTGKMIFTSHEALHLAYEQTLTRQVGRYYNLSTHLPWVGVRTGAIDGAHLEYCRGIANPIAVKIGANADPKWLSALLERLNPECLSGKLMLITRLGFQHVDKVLPPLIAAVKRLAMPVVWCCDPMHGNTLQLASGIKTRKFDAMRLELQRTISSHLDHGSHLGGLHIEMTADNVTECLGGRGQIRETHLGDAYLSAVDPRLNHQQALEMVNSLVALIRRQSVES